MNIYCSVSNYSYFCIVYFDVYHVYSSVFNFYCLFFCYNCVFFY